MLLDIFYRSYYCFTGDLSTESVKVSPKYQVVIPQSIREALKIHPGEKFHILQYESRIEFIPEKEMKSMRGFLKGIDTTVKWDNDRI